MSRVSSLASLSRGAALALCLPAAVTAQTYTEDFVDRTVLPSQGWTLVNNALFPGSTSWGNSASFLAQAGAPNSVITANYLNAADHASICTWMMLPPFHSESEMSFWTRSNGDANYSDRLYVVRSPTGGTGMGHCDDGFGDFTETVLIINESLGGDYPEAWTRFAIPGSASGARLALVYFVTDAGGAGSEGDIIGIDTVTFVPFNADLSVALASNAVAPVATGSIVTFAVTVVNAGDDASTGTAVSGSFSTNLGAYTSNCGMVFTGDTFTWSPGSLAVDGTAVCSVTAMMQGPGYPALEAAVSGTLFDANPVNNAASLGLVTRLYVDDNAAAGGDGLSWATAYDTLQTALAYANRGTEVWVAAGRYRPDQGLGQINDDVLSTFVLPDDARLLGGFAGTETSAEDRDRDANVTVLSGDLASDDVVDANGITLQWEDLRGSNARHLLTATDASAGTLVDGFALTAGSASGATSADQRGAILSCSGSSLMTLSDVTVIGAFMSNRAALDGCTLEVSSSEFVSNRATDVGAVTTNSGTWTDVLFMDNSASSQASVFYMGGGSVTLRNVAFLGNTSGGTAGAVRVQGATVDAENVLFSGNHGGHGTALNMSGSSSASLRNVTLSGNRSAGTSGGIRFDSTGTLEIVNSVLWNNSHGAGIGTAGASLTASGTGVVTVRDSLWQGSGGSTAWSVANVVDGGDNLDIDPRFRTATNPATTPTLTGDLRLRYVSVALEAGDNTAVTLAQDLDGEQRVQGANVDLGAYEGAVVEADVIAAFDPVLTDAVAGATQAYTLRVSNPANAEASGITVTDDFPVYLDCSWLASASGGASGQANGVGDLLQTLSLPAGASVTYNVLCSINSAASGTLAHTATASVSAIDYDASNNSSAVSRAITRVADLSVTLDDGLTQVAGGDTLTYTAIVENAGPSDVLDAPVATTFSTTLTGCTWQCAAGDGASCAPGPTAGNIADLADLPAGGSVTYTAQCSVPMQAEFEMIASSASVTAPSGATDPESDNNSDSDENTRTPSADIAVAFEAVPFSVAAGDSAVFTLRVSNVGGLAASGVAVSDDIPAGFDCEWTASASGGATGHASGQGDLLQTLTLPIGSAVAYAFTCDVSGDASGTFTHTATASTAAGETVTANNTATMRPLVIRVTQSGLVLSDGDLDAVAGQSHAMTLVVRNNGPSNAHDAVVNVDFDAALTCAWSTTSSAGASGTVSGSGDIAELVQLPDDATLTYAISCAVPSNFVAAGFDTSASLVVQDIDTFGGDNVAQDSTTVLRSNALSVSLGDAGQPAIPGLPYTMTLVASNGGASDAPNAMLAMDLDETLACTWTATMLNGAVGATQGSGDLQQTLDLPTGSSASYVIDCSVPPDRTAPLAATATLSAAGTDSATDTESAPITPFADLGVAIDDGLAVLDAGDTTTYTVTLSNAGPSAAFGAVVAVPFEVPLSDCAWTCSASGGSQCTTAQGTGNIAQDVTVAAGAAVVFTAQCSVPVQANFASVVVTATVTAAAGTADANVANNTASDVDASAVEAIFSHGFE